jgi:hypothetical protein
MAALVANPPSPLRLKSEPSSSAEGSGADGSAHEHDEADISSFFAELDDALD